MKSIRTLSRGTCFLLAAGVAAVLAQTSALRAADPRERISIDDDWRFIKGDPAGITDNLTYPHSPATNGRRQSADIGPYPGAATTGIAAYILPTGNAFISNPEKHFPKPDGNYGATIPYVSPAFDDSAWRKLDLPHDVGIEGPFIPNGNGDMGKLPFFGALWYRKDLAIPATDAGKQVFLDMDGSMSYTTVWCNGQIVGGWPYGYSSFRLDLTSFLKPGAANMLAIRLDNPNNSSRWYPGGGIYRNVWLTKTSPVHVGQWGTYLTTPDVSASSATVNLKVSVDNQSAQDGTVTVSTAIVPLDANGQMPSDGPPAAVIAPADVAVKAGSSAMVEGKVTLTNPKLWSPDSPNRYMAITTVRQNGNVLDQYQTPFGIRTLKFDPNEGLFINGEHFKLNGVCDHHDLGSLGTAVNVRALQRQLQMLRDMGCNAIRTSHNPPAPELLEFADQMGFMVLDESFDTWQSHKSGHNNDYGGDMLFNAWHEQDTRALVRRDRNHPSIIMWSIGNEIDEQSQGGNSNVAKELAAIVHSEDLTRPVTAACNGGNSARNGFGALLDTMGFNYKPDDYIPFHRDFPNQSFFATETSSTISSRGEYFFPVTPNPFGVVNQSSNPGRGGGRRGGGGAPATTSGPASAPASAPARAFLSQDDATRQMSSYDLYHPGWASSPEHEFFGQDHSAACMGEFVWTGWDYIGEPTPFAQNGARSSYFGIIDLAGFPKDRYYLYQAHWRPELPMAHILPHWNWPDRVGQVTPVHVYTSGDEAELFLNGKSLGRKKKVFDGVGQPQAVNGIALAGQPGYRIRWDDVVYAPGELKVVAYKDGKQWATDTVKTTDAASKLLLKPDRDAIAGDGHDLSFITLTVADKEGLMVPRTHNAIHFDITGPGEIVATDNGDPNDMNIFSLPDRKAFNGLALAIVKAKRGGVGPITVTATSDGLTRATTTITIK